MLVDDAAARAPVVLGEVPAGGYTGIRFTLGVDGIDNRAAMEDFPAGHPLAPQDPSMHWSWNSGYVFLRLRGLLDVDGDGAVDASTATPGNPASGQWRLHLGVTANATTITLAERSTLEAGETQDLHVRVDLARFVQGIDYAVPANREVVAGISGSTYRFRLYRQRGSRLDGRRRGERAGAAGRGLRGRRERVGRVRTERDVTFGEPLPMVPPVGGVVALQYDRRAVFAEVETRWALAQTRVARFTYAEQPTNGFALMALRAGWQQPARPAAGLRVQAGAGIENLLDTFYREHLAISDLSARGRSAYLSLGIDL